MKKKAFIFICSLMTVSMVIGAASAYAKDETASLSVTEENETKREKDKIVFAKITSVEDNKITVLKAEIPKPAVKSESDESSIERTEKSSDKPKSPTKSDDADIKPHKRDNSEFLSKLSFTEEETIDISNSSIIDDNLTEFKEEMIIVIKYDSNDNIERIMSSDKMPMKKGGRKHNKALRQKEAEAETEAQSEAL